MKRKILAAGLVLFLGGSAASGFRTASRSPLPSSEGRFTDLFAHPGERGKIFALAPHGVYLRETGRGWKRPFFLPEGADFHHLVPHPTIPEKVYLVAGEGVLEGNLQTGRGRWIFRGESYPDKRVHFLAFHPEDPKQIYLATDEGLFLSGDGGETWLQSFRWPENQSIQLVAFLPTDPPSLLLGTAEELFFSRDGGETFESGFSLPAMAEEGGGGEENLEEGEDGNAFHALQFSSFAFSADSPLHLWVGTRQGVFESEDGGIVWRKLTDRGLQGLRVQDLVFSEKAGLIGTFPNGVAQYRPDQKRWETIPLGLTQPPEAITLAPPSESHPETLLVASGTEVLEWELSPLEADGASLFLPSPRQFELFRKLLDREPTIREVQSAAIRYGGLGNGKIRRWHWGSRMRALVPRLNFGRSFSLGNNVDIDRGGTNDPDRFIFGPNEFDKGWDMGLTWDLGDFLYSTAQTSIDSRAKFLVELRESILSQVTRIYFERRRVQMEAAFSGEKTQQESFDLLLRLDELTAQIDALTDGFLSKKKGLGDGFEKEA